MLPSLASLALVSPRIKSYRTPSDDVGTKRARTVATGVVLPPRDTVGLKSLNANGVATFPFDNIKGKAFVTQLRRCTNDWFQSNFRLMLDNGTSTMLQDATVRTAKAEWDGLSAEARRAYAERIDLRTDEGMKLAFDPDYLAKQEWWKTMSGNTFFRKAVIYVKQGNVGMSLGNMAGAWTAKGFGLWAHIVPDVGLPMVTEAMNLMIQLGLEPGLPEHFPHPIYKPPGGAALEIHHDQMAPRELLNNLRTHVVSNDPSTTAWVRTHGLQMLAHLQGGTGSADGATFVVGPMTPAKLLVCLEAYSEGRLGGNYEEWNEKGRGKVDLDWERHLDGINLELSKAGYDSVGLLAAAPLDSARGEHADASFGVYFPVGWPHGSFSNHKSEDAAAQQGSRITVTLPITMRGSTQTPDERIPTRLRNMAILSTSGHTAAQYAAAEAWLVNDGMPYADGPTHKRPNKVVDLIRHPDAPGPTGPFHSIVVKPNTVEQYLLTLKQLTSFAAATVSPTVSPSASSSTSLPLLPEGAPHRVDTFHYPPDASVLDADVRMLKVKQPWAEYLVKGIKNIENRLKPLIPSTGFPAWVLVVSSLEKPGAALMEDLRRRLTHIKHGLALANGMDPKEYEYGHILGMIKIETCTRNPPPSVWYNSPDVAWVVSDAWEFETPIPMDPDDGMQSAPTRLEIRPQYRTRILEEMAKLKPGEP